MVLLKISTLIFVLCVISTGSASKCCKHGTVLKKEWKCKNLLTNVSAPVTLGCPNKAKLLVSHKKDEPYYIDEEDKLVFVVPNRIVTYESDKYCESENGDFVLVCDMVNHNSILPDAVFSASMTASVVCYFITAVVHVISKNSNLSIVNLCMSQAMAFLILVIMRTVEYTDMNLCALRGFLGYYFLLVSFFWMTAISFEILDTTVGVQRKHYFAAKAAFAWGIPALLTIVMVIINFIPGDHLKPGIGLNDCWFFDATQKWIYMYSVMLVLFMVNFVIFIHVSMSKCRGPSYDSHDSYKHRLSSCVRLAIVMGLTWIFEMITSLTEPALVWEIVDVFNCLVGVWVFLALVKFNPREVIEAHTSASTKRLQCIGNIIATEPSFTSDFYSGTIDKKKLILP